MDNINQRLVCILVNWLLLTSLISIAEAYTSTIDYGTIDMTTDLLLSTTPEETTPDVFYTTTVTGTTATTSTTTHTPTSDSMSTREPTTTFVPTTELKTTGMETTDYKTTGVGVEPSTSPSESTSQSASAATKLSTTDVSYTTTVTGTTETPSTTRYTSTPDSVSSGKTTTTFVPTTELKTTGMETTDYKTTSGRVEPSISPSESTSQSTRATTELSTTDSPIVSTQDKVTTLQQTTATITTPHSTTVYTTDEQTTVTEEPTTTKPNTTPQGSTSKTTTLIPEPITTKSPSPTNVPSTSGKTSSLRSSTKIMTSSQTIYSSLVTTPGKPTTGETDGSTTGAIIITMSVVIILLLLLLLVALLYCRRHRNRPTGGVEKPTRITSDLFQMFEFSRDNLAFEGIIGKGNHTQVMKAKAWKIGVSSDVSTVAVKMLHDEARNADRDVLLAELETTRRIPSHPNIISLLGYCVDYDPYYIIYEYATLGHLQHYLRSIREEIYYGDNVAKDIKKSTIGELLLQFAEEIAEGMTYLAQSEIIHGDLSSLSIHVTENDGVKKCKISDIGKKSGQRGNLDSYGKKRLPIRWMSPESMREGEYTTKSDVWSFGVVVWEIVTLGATPYFTMSSSEVEREVKNGGRLNKPEHCSDSLYSILRECWIDEPKLRPTMKNRQKKLLQLRSAENFTEHIEMADFNPNLFGLVDKSTPGERC
uniref:Muscle, skeletal receptor tyrosine-protein kinase-like n=1 Tax=Saccoglossus kowalevskii TaxID=10224 RepID=A0ABM0MC10_SACKO|nr:PREDICTED: muscle, skeletal receptor tyrosine-protein kinase-like [Saccoglossus kowalevskii]